MQFKIMRTKSNPIQYDKLLVIREMENCDIIHTETFFFLCSLYFIVWCVCCFFFCSVLNDTFFFGEKIFFHKPFHNPIHTHAYNIIFSILLPRYIIMKIHKNTVLVDCMHYKFLCYVYHKKKKSKSQYVCGCECVPTTSYVYVWW